MSQNEKKSLKKLKRSELLEIMLAQSEEIERLRGELAQKDAQLEQNRIAISESGSIAEASLKLTKVFEEAQKAADIYLANVKQGPTGRAQGPTGRTQAHEQARAERERRLQVIEAMKRNEPRGEAVDATQTAGDTEAATDDGTGEREKRQKKRHRKKH